MSNLQNGLCTDPESCQKLIEAEEKYRTLVENAENAMFSISCDGVFIMLNKVAAETLGGKPEDYIGKKMQSFFPPEIAERQLRTVQRVIDTGVSEAVEALTVIKSEPRWYLTNIQPLIRPSLNDTLALLISTDITERKELENALQQSIATNEAMLKAHPDLVFLTDLNGTYVEYKGGNRPDLLVPAEKVVGANVSQVLSAEDTKKFFECVKQTMDTGSVEHLDYRVEIGGERRDYEARIIRCNEAEVLIVSRDVTHQRRIEEALRESEEQFRNLAEYSLQSIFLTQDNRVIFVNRKAAEMLETTVEEMSSLSTTELFQKFMHPQHVETVRSRYAARLRGEQAPDQYEVMVRTVRGTEKWVELSAKVTTYQGRPAVQAVLVDISQRRAAEMALKREKNTLDKVIGLNPYAIALWDLGGHFISSNQAWIELFKVIPPDDYSFFESPEAELLGLEEEMELLRGGETVKLPEMWYNPHDINPDLPDAPFCLNATIFPILRENGQAEFYAAMFENVTERRKAEESLNIANEHLEAERQTLLEKNIALKEVMSQVKAEVNQVKRHIESNVERILMPVLQKLKEKSDSRDRVHVELIESLLQDITSPFVSTIESRFANLTHRESEVCKMIRKGLRSKEIAAVLGISVRTVEKFRENIRIKLGLGNGDTNLRSFLKSFLQT